MLMSCMLVRKMVCTSVMTVVVRVPCLVPLDLKWDIMGRQKIMHWQEYTEVIGCHLRSKRL